MYLIYKTTKPINGSRINWGNSITKGLANVWLFNECRGFKVEDLVGVSNGTMGGFNNSSTSGWVGGKYGIGISFDGTDDNIDCGSSETLDFSSAFSGAALIYPRTLGANNGGRIFDKRDEAGTQGYGINLTTINRFQLNCPGVGSVTSSNNAIILNAWNFIVATKVGGASGAVNLYVNGVNVGTGTLNDFVANSGESLIIGAGANSAARWFDGIIMYVCLWRRVLSPGEVKNLYNFPYYFIYAHVRRPIFPTIVSGAININRIERKFSRGVLRGIGRGR